MSARGHPLGRRSGGRRAGRPAGAADRSAFEMGLALGSLLVRPGEAIVQRYERKDQAGWAGEYAAASWGKKESDFFEKKLKVDHAAKKWLGSLSRSAWREIISRLEPVLDGSKDLAWAQREFEARSGENMKRRDYVAELTRCTAAKKILEGIIKNNPDDSSPELLDKWIVARREAAKTKPVIAALPQIICHTTFHYWLSEVAYRRGSTPTIRLTKADLPNRVEWCTTELSLPEHATDASFRSNTLHRSIAADGFQYDHHDACRKHATGYVPRQGSRFQSSSTLSSR